MRICTKKQRNGDQVYLLRCRGKLTVWRDKRSAVEYAWKHGHRNGVYQLSPICKARARALFIKEKAQGQFPWWESPVMSWSGGRHRRGYVTDLKPPRKNAADRQHTALFVAQTPDGDVAWAERRPVTLEQMARLGLTSEQS